MRDHLGDAIMGQSNRDEAVFDSRVLSCFLAVQQQCLLFDHPTMRGVVTEFATRDLKRMGCPSLHEVDAAITSHRLVVAQITPQNALFHRLVSSGRFSAGECAAVAVAVERNALLLTDTAQLARAAEEQMPPVRTARTEGFVVSLIRIGHMTVPLADAMLARWAEDSWLNFPFGSFSERL